MQVLITGATGLIGRTLTARLIANDDQPLQLGRSGADQPFWASLPDQPIDAVVHLAGEPIAARRWSTEQKQRIRDSRVIGTEQLCEQVARLTHPPKLLIAASAGGFYGDRGDEILTEGSIQGRGFLAEVCRDWEAACEPARLAGIRVVNLRIGVVLSSEGGALAKLRPLFKTGLGGKLGDGRQYMSWIGLADLIEAIMFVLENDSITGPVNGVSPNPVTNAEFTNTLGRLLHRPTIFSVPSFVLRLAVGEMADEMLLISQRMIPKTLTDAGFSFTTPELANALDIS